MLRFLALTVLIPFLFVRSAANDLWLKIRGGAGNGHPVDLPRCSARDVNLKKLMARGRPIIIEGLAESLELAHTADLASLISAARPDGPSFKVSVYDSSAPYFLYTGNYGKKLLRTEAMNLHQFLERMFNGDGFQGEAVYRMFFQTDLDGLADSVLEEMVGALRTSGNTEPQKDASGIWIGSKGVTTPLHYDAWQGLLFQMHGNKRVTLYAPDDIPKLYFLTQFAVGKRWSHLPGRSAEAEPSKFPRLREATPYRGVLKKGDALFIPSFWPHEAEAMEPNISVPFRFGVKVSDYLHPRFLRPACDVMYGQYLRKWLKGPIRGWVRARVRTVINR